jgi:glycosyltransferase involved in cell wall biosynthesis
MTMPMRAPAATGAHLSAVTTEPGVAHDGSILLMTPVDDVDSPEVSVVIPAVNEQLTITEFVGWCKEGLASAGLRGEILIVDSSTDLTAELALEAGARVLKTPKRGLGRAYIDAVPFIRGKYIVMGDADLTYDFRDLGLFVEKMREGYEFAMGSRWAGSIEEGSMPALHRYLGTPATTWILNRVYSSHFTDIHCGMRGITLDALKRMGLSSQSWEYASEMVLKSVRMGLRTAEVPVTFYKDRDGRLSHHKRSGWTSPFSAAWINLRAMFVYGAEFFMLKPGIVLLVVGLLLSLPLSFGSFTIGNVTFGLYWMLIGVALAVIGLQSFFFGCLAQVFCDYSGAARDRWMRIFTYSRSVLASLGLFLIGLAGEIALLWQYASHGGRLPPASSTVDHLAVTGMLFMIAGFSLFCFTLLLHATGVRYGIRQTVRPPSTIDASV